ncbi:hypothetical protein DWB84_01955 [Saccharophagus sp. K07]|uniref:hypothetical protein n=1 Tax=Saccharophagus sp. K07 TaxID=2283636 RepID=UPI0016525F11|nr:hypothetical protein [Saccharophagus sp. K07]MBC6904236.1 hypothetical protein [Saccharophagus sp. K07]
MAVGRWAILYIVISIGVMSGNLASNYITAWVAAYQLEKAVKAMEERLKADKIKDLEALLKRNALALENTKESAENAEIQRQRNRTCNFWIQEYNRTRSELDKSHRDVACRDAGRPFSK